MLDPVKLEADFDKLVTTYRDRTKPKVIVLLPIPIPSGQPVGVTTTVLLPANKAVAAKYNLPVVDTYTAFLNKKEYFKDVTHVTNGPGLKLITEMVLAAIKALPVDGAPSPDAAPAGNGSPDASVDVPAASGGSSGSSSGGASGSVGSGGLQRHRRDQRHRWLVRHRRQQRQRNWQRRQRCTQGRQRRSAATPDEPAPSGCRFGGSNRASLPAGPADARSGGTRGPSLAPPRLEIRRESRSKRGAAPSLPHNAVQIRMPECPLFLVPLPHAARGRGSQSVKDFAPTFRLGPRREAWMLFALVEEDPQPLLAGHRDVQPAIAIEIGGAVLTPKTDVFARVQQWCGG